MSAARPRVHIANRRTGGLWWRAPLVLGAWLLLAAPVVAAAVVIATLRDYAADVPVAPDLDAWAEHVPRSSVILAADGTVLAELPFQDGAAVGHRQWATFDELPQVLIDAILAAEDVRFFEHDGIDARAVARAAWANYRAGRVVEGASTITQQLARNLLPEDIGTARTLRRKVREALLARRLERRHDKARIFEAYANLVFLGANAYGVRAAARAYFDRDLDALGAAEAALLAGLIQAPGRTDPYRAPEAARARRDEVLERMHRAGLLDAAALTGARATPLILRPPPERYGQLAPWYTERARQEIAGAFPEAYARGGLIVDTAVAPASAIAAEARARAWSARLARRESPPPQIGALVWDHRTDYVELTVGGLDWQRSQFDRATQACRQPGSAFKPILYAAAIEADVITPGTALRDAPVTEYDEEHNVFWKPDNSGRAFRGVALAHDALVASLNAPAIDVLDRVGVERVIALARRLGITTELTALRPVALGASCVIPLELAGAYAILARGGDAGAPIFVTRVRRAGDVLRDRASFLDPGLAPARRLDRLALAPRRERVLDEASAHLVSRMLRDVVRRGTGRAASALDQPAAGKTGTTNDNTDAWFVGYTARAVGAVWIGHDDPARPLGPRQDGSHAALPLWVQLLRLAEGQRPGVELPGPPPPALERAAIDRDTGLLARPGSGGLELYFKPGTAPTATAGGAPDIPAGLGRVSREF